MVTKYYRDKLAEGQWYQDYVAERLYRAGIFVGNYQSKDFQYRLGENVLGLEIKNDQKMANTGNLYIETAEKSRADAPSFVRSGIYAHDRSWLYGVGDLLEFFIFSQKFLRNLHRTGRYVVVENRTSRGFLLPHADAERVALRRFVWGPRSVG